MIPLPTNEHSRWKSEHVNLDILHHYPLHKTRVELQKKLNKMVKNHRANQNPIDMF